MSIKCCGIERESKYCPDCGKRLYHKPIYELQNHLEIEVKKLKSRLKHNKLSRNSKALEKWTNWLVALTKPIEKDERVSDGKKKKKKQ